jgi:DNA-3-methyladenine glycosylase II
VLARLIDEHGPPVIDASDRPVAGDHYGALVRTIVGQQLSTLAARSIYKRLIGLFDGRAPTPQEILDYDPDELKPAAGLSRAKTQYLRSLAEHVLSGELELERLDALDDDTVIAELVAVKGIGEWSAHMFLMFQLERQDVIAPGDLGVRKGIQVAWEMDALPTPAQVIEMAERWRPWRTVACRVLWHSLDATPA